MKFDAINASPTLHPQVNIEYINEMQEHIQTGNYQPNFNDLSDTIMGGNDTRAISVVWPEAPPDGYIHIFVRAPHGLNLNSSE